MTIPRDKLLHLALGVLWLCATAVIKAQAETGVAAHQAKKVDTPLEMV